MEERQTLKFKAPIIIHSFLALGFSVLGCINYFFFYDIIEFHKFTVAFPDFWGLISLFLNIAPYVLFVIYILIFYNKRTMTFFVPVALLLITFSPLNHTVYVLYEHNKCNKDFYGLINRYRGHFVLSKILDTPSIFVFVLYILTIFAFVLATIDALKGFYKKTFLIIAIIFGSVVEFNSIFGSFYLDRTASSFTVPYLPQFFGALGIITFYIALLLFGLKNRIPPILIASPKNEMDDLKRMSPERALKLLKEKLDLGMITKEEYTSQRSDIINKL